MKKLFILTCIALLGFSACSDDDDNNNILRDTKLKLVASKTQIEPFQDIKVSISNDIEVLRSAYDSVMWKTKSTAYASFYIPNNDWLQDDSRDIRVTSYKTGTYSVYAEGYKDGKLTSIDSVQYEVVKPTGDFFNIRWKYSDKNQYLRCTVGQTPAKIKETAGGLQYSGTSLELNSIVENVETEYATLQFMPWSLLYSKRNVKVLTVPDIDDLDWDFILNDYNRDKFKQRHDFEYNFLHSYVVNTYGDPSFTYDGNDPTKTTLTDEYNKRFNYISGSKLYPYEIWDTPTSYICILSNISQFGTEFVKGGYVVVAQPRY